MELPSTMKTDFPDPNDVLNFKLTIDPDEGAVLDSNES
jgi:ubiquitin-conjugating enzyme E2 M